MNKAKLASVVLAGVMGASFPGVHAQAERVEGNLSDPSSEQPAEETRLAPSAGQFVEETLFDSLSTDLWSVTCRGRGDISADVGILNSVFMDNGFRVTVTCTLPGRSAAADTQTVYGSGVSADAIVSNCRRALIAYQCYTGFCDEGYDSDIDCLGRSMRNLSLLQDE